MTPSIRRPQDAHAAWAFYAGRVQAAAAQHAVWAAEIYATHQRHADAPFWRRRRGVKRESAPRLPVRPVTPHAPVRLAARVKTIEASCLVGDFVEVRRAIQADPDMEPIVFIADIEIAPILDRIVPGCTCAALEATIGAHAGPAVARQVVAWLLAREILEAA